MLARIPGTAAFPAGATHVRRRARPKRIVHQALLVLLSFQIIRRDAAAEGIGQIGNSAVANQPWFDERGLVMCWTRLRSSDVLSASAAVKGSVG